MAPVLRLVFAATVASSVAALKYPYLQDVFPQIDVSNQQLEARDDNDRLWALRFDTGGKCDPNTATYGAYNNSGMTCLNLATDKDWDSIQVWSQNLQVALYLGPDCDFMYDECAFPCNLYGGVQNECVTSVGSSAPGNHFAKSVAISNNYYGQNEGPNYADHCQYDGIDNGYPIQRKPGAVAFGIGQANAHSGSSSADNYCGKAPQGTGYTWELGNVTINDYTYYGLACFELGALTGASPNGLDRYDVEALNCLLNEHTKNSFVCISVSGSPCQPCYGGHIDNLEFAATGSGSQSGLQLNHDQALAFGSFLNGMFQNAPDQQYESLRLNLFRSTDYNSETRLIKADLEVNFEGSTGGC